jgi:hypothetical protein
VSSTIPKTGASDRPRWRVAGSYFEVCNCDAVCPCRRVGDREGGRSTTGICDFALSWLIREGHCNGLDVSNRQVVLAGSYDDDEPDSPWRVALYVDNGATAAQHDNLSAIFLGRAGGTTLRNFAASIGEVRAVRSAEIRLDHTADHQLMEVRGHVQASALRPVLVDQAVSCGIPGFDHPGTELIAGAFQVTDDPLRWSVTGRCGFATDFAYDSDA